MNFWSDNHHKVNNLGVGYGGGGESDGLNLAGEVDRLSTSSLRWRWLYCCDVDRSLSESA